MILFDAWLLVNGECSHPFFPKLMQFLDIAQVILENLAGATNPVYVRRGDNAAQVNKGQKANLEPSDVLEFDTWRPRSERLYCYRLEFINIGVPATSRDPPVKSGAGSPFSPSRQGRPGAFNLSPSQGSFSSPSKTASLNQTRCPNGQFAVGSIVEVSCEAS